VLIAMKTVLGPPLRGFMLVVAGRGGGIQSALYSHMIFMERWGGGVLGGHKEVLVGRKFEPGRGLGCVIRKSSIVKSEIHKTHPIMPLLTYLHHGAESFLRS
jgi:hypothetical protein